MKGSNTLQINDSFKPLWPFKSGWAQTIAAMYFPQNSLPQVDKFHRIELLDGDHLILCENVPSGKVALKNRGILLIHGLTGSAYSKDSSRLGAVLLGQGYHVFRLNLRNCGPGFGLSTGIYHSGRSEDARATVKYIQSIYSDLKLTQVGFSLGGNITLKMAGEDGESPSGNIDSVIAVCPPADLSASSKKLARKENKIFDQYFVKQLKRDVFALNKVNPRFEIPYLPEFLSLTEFDDYFTAPRGGFKSAADYYAKASSINLIHNIAVKTLIIGAKDDPVVDLGPIEKLNLKAHQQLVATNFGGHCGYLGRGPDAKGLRWMDHVISRWLFKLNGD